MFNPWGASTAWGIMVLLHAVLVSLAVQVAEISTPVRERDSSEPAGCVLEAGVLSAKGAEFVQDVGAPAGDTVGRGPSFCHEDAIMPPGSNCGVLCSAGYGCPPFAAFGMDCDPERANETVLKCLSNSTLEYKFECQGAWQPI